MVYAVVNLTITDPKMFDAYRELAGAALAKHGAQVVRSTKDVVVLDGTPEVPTIAVILSFPDKDAALNWANDPEIAEVHALRRGAGTSNILLLN